MIILIIDHGSICSKLTFKKRDRWLSELDYCFVSKDIAGECVTGLSVSVLADVTHPVCKLSDHAPMSIEFKFAADPNMLVERSRTLCEHVVPSDCETRCIAPISIKKIDPVKFSKCLSDIEPPPLDLDAHDIALPFAECMYSVASRSKAY